MEILIKRRYLKEAGLFLLITGILVLTSVARADTSAGTEPSKYTLGPDDVVEISVTNHPEFTGTYPINVDGKIQYTYVGDIDVNGMTKDELKEKIKDMITKYVNSPDVNVTITDFKSKVFYVLGEVGKPGQYHMRSENITVKEALSMAGFPTQAASLRKAKIIKSSSNGSGTREIDLYSLLYSEDQKDNAFLNPGDSLYVPAALSESVSNGKDTGNGSDPLKYTLGPDDIIEINVMGHPEFSGIYPISLEGKIQYSYVGDISVTGMTKGQLEEKIKKTISAYVASPEVSIKITGFKSKSFYVVGEVAKPGQYHMRSESISVKEAVTMAGLPTRAASMQHARVITPNNNGGTAKEVDLYSLLYSDDQKDNVFLKPGDTLYIPAAAMQSATKMNEDKKNFDPLGYTLGPDDVIEISVMNHLEFSGIYPVSLEGKVQYKFVGDIYVTGMTKGQLEEKLKAILSAYVPSPQVNVLIREFRSKAFYVIGEVRNPGKYYMRSDNITVSEAVVMAGLPVETAAMRKTRILTPGVNGAVVRKVNLYSLLYEGDTKEDLFLYPGDYLYVPATVLGKIIRIFSPVATTIGLAAGPAADVGNGRAGAAAAVK
jgi:protein involved in polysaccharide export with SLBB domain